MSDSDDSSDASPQISSDVGVDLDTKLRQRREETRRQRLQEFQQRRQAERQRQAEERKRRQLQNDIYQNDHGEEGDNIASLGSVFNNKSLSVTIRKSSNSSMDARSTSNNSYDLLLSSPSPRVKFKSGPTKFNPSPSHSRSSGSSCLRSSSSLQRYNNDAKANNNCSATQQKKQKSTYASSSDSSDDDGKINRFPKGGWSNAQRVGTSYATHNNSKNHGSEPHRKPIPAKATTKRRSDSDDSESSEDPVEAMMRVMRAKKEKEAAAVAAVVASATTSSGNSRARSSLSHSSEKNRGSAITSKRSPRDHYSNDSDDDEDTDEDMASAAQQLRRESEAKRYKHNPIAMERREREEREVQRRKNISANTKTFTPNKAKLEGMEVMVGDEGEVKSVSDMADDARDARIGRAGRGDGVGGGDARGKMTWQKPSHVTNNQRWRYDDEDGSPDLRRHCNINQAAKMRDNSDDDGLWDSSDSDDGKQMTTKQKPKARVAKKDTNNYNGGKKREQIMQKDKSGSPRIANRGKSTVASNEASSSDDSYVRRRKKYDVEKRRRRHSFSSDSENNNTMQKMPPSGYGLDDADQSDNASDGEVERRKNQLKPDFADPKLGTPGPLVPFVLSKTWKVGDSLVGCDDVDDMDGYDDNQTRPARHTTDGDIDQVPASINRYLKGYQRMGIQFMYSSVVHGKGCVLGDDMGLGKTVQCISLIAALLKKSGTGCDSLELKEHYNKVKKILQEQEESRQKALLTGFGLKHESSLESTVFPRFAPILIVVPSSVVENWQVSQRLFASNLRSHTGY